MKGIFVLFLILTKLCLAQDFKNVTLLDHWSNDALTTSSTKVRYNDCWGYAAYGKEYAILGSTEGIHIFEINEDSKLIEKDFVEGAFSSAQVVHRDIKTFGHYLYAVCDEGNSTLQIIDMSYLPDSVHLVSETSDKIGRAHNLFVDENNSLLFAFKVTPIINNQVQPPVSMRVFTLSDPTNPILVYDGPNDIAEVHDGYVRDKIAILNCGVDGLRRYDFSNPSSPLFIQSLPLYQDQGYNHQGWLNPKGDVYIFGDETNGKKLKKCSVASNGEIQIESNFGVGHTAGSVPHNIMLDEQFVYVAYYNYGLRIFDYSRIPVEQVGFYDTYPEEVVYQMNGAWGVYSNLPSGRILVSDRQNGLFLFDFNRQVFKNRSSETLQFYPNPINEGENLTLFLNSNYTGKLKYRITDRVGKKVGSGEMEYFNHFEIPMNLASGVYTIEIDYVKNIEIIRETAVIVVR